MAGSTTMEHIIPATLAVFAGSIVEGILGFGCSLVWMSFFPLFTTVPDAVGVLQPMHIALNVILLARIWKKCTPKELAPLALTVPFGIIFGLWIVTSWSSNAIDCVLGLFLIAYTFLKNEKDETCVDLNNQEDRPVSSGCDKGNKSFVRKSSDLELDSSHEIDAEEEKKDDCSILVEEMPHHTLEMSPLIHRHPISTTDTGSVNIPSLHNTGNASKSYEKKKPLPTLNTTALKTINETSNFPDMLRNPTAICAGLVGGALMGAFGTGGPALLIYAKEAGWQKQPELFRANLQLLFFVINVPCCLSQFVEGIITYERCKASCCLLPALLFGGQIGGMLAKRVSRDKFQILVVNGLRIIGLMFLVEATR